jgi:hypothetical protein
MTMPWPWPVATDARAICRRFPLSFRRTFGHGRSSPGGLVWFALQAQILLAQLKGDQERVEEVRERLQVSPGVAPSGVAPSGVAPSAPAQLRRGRACACWRTCVHARACVRAFVCVRVLPCSHCIVASIGGVPTLWRMDGTD